MWGGYDARDHTSSNTANWVEPIPGRVRQKRTIEISYYNGVGILERLLDSVKVGAWVGISGEGRLVGTDEGKWLVALVSCCCVCGKVAV